MKKKTKATPGDYKFFDRDLSWLSFNERVLTEAERTTVPLMERIRFLSIYSSNLDEFYRVRMPALMALKGLSSEGEAKKLNALLPTINAKILQQQKHFGSIIKNQILTTLKDHHIHLVYNEPPPDQIAEPLKGYFINAVAAYIHIVPVSDNAQFFPENNKLYILVATDDPKKGKRFYIVNIPSDVLSRIFACSYRNTQYLVFLDDIIKLNLSKIFYDQEIIGSYSFKITRDAELDLQDEFTGNLSKKIEKKIGHRDFGLATRFLYEPGIPENTLELLKSKLNLKGANFIQGGAYHNLKDLATLPLKDQQFHYEQWPQVSFKIRPDSGLLQEIRKRDILLHLPYHSYDTVLRFFNEAAIDPSVIRIYVTLYRVANDSRIVNALISAAKNGKKVIVFVELKARFDEANNIKWSKKMKAAGVRIIESIPGLKVHAKLALIKRKTGKKTESLGLFATGNFNESTARYYTDHILMTAHKPMLREAESLFLFLKKRKRPSYQKQIFQHLLVGQFNLQQGFIALIDREITNAKNGSPASVIIKFNNLEDTVLISKLYEASNASVKISLIVRGICCLVPGIKGMSENISVRRIIDRYLEHGRIFIFHNNNEPQVYLGSADWMNRNIYRRIEVCFQVYDADLKTELINIIDLQLSDNCQAVSIDEHCNNVISGESGQIRSQRAIGELLLADQIKPSE